MLLHSLLRDLYSLVDKCTWWSFWGQKVQDKRRGMDFSPLTLVMAMGMLAHCISLPHNELCLIPSQFTRSGLAVPPTHMAPIMSGIHYTAWIYYRHFCLYPVSGFCPCLWKYCIPSQILCLTSCILYMYITVHHPYNPVSCFLPSSWSL